MIKAGFQLRRLIPLSRGSGAPNGHMLMKYVVVGLFSAAVAGCTKPADISQSCTTNGFGAVECTFTNKGAGDGSVCVKLKLTNNAYKEMVSEEICSGIVKASDVVERRRSASFPMQPSDFCEVPRHRQGQSWNDVCELSVERM